MMADSVVKPKHPVQLIRHQNISHFGVLANPDMGHPQGAMPMLESPLLLPVESQHRPSCINHHYGGALLTVESPLPKVEFEHLKFPGNGHHARPLLMLESELRKVQSQHHELHANPDMGQLGGQLPMLGSDIGHPRGHLLMSESLLLSPVEAEQPQLYGNLHHGGPLLMLKSQLPMVKSEHHQLHANPSMDHPGEPPLMVELPPDLKSQHHQLHGYPIMGHPLGPLQTLEIPLLIWESELRKVQSQHRTLHANLDMGHPGGKLLQLESAMGHPGGQLMLESPPVLESQHHQQHGNPNIGHPGGPLLMVESPMHKVDTEHRQLKENPNMGHTRGLIVPRELPQHHQLYRNPDLSHPGGQMLKVESPLLNVESQDRLLYINGNKSSHCGQLLMVESQAGLTHGSGGMRSSVGQLLKVKSEHQEFQEIGKTNKGGGGEKLGDESIIPWSLESSLGLLKEIKAFVRNKNVPKVGADLENWKEIAANLSNPLHLELTAYAKSCKDRFWYMWLNRKECKAEVRESLADYAQICGSFRDCWGARRDIVELSSDSEEEKLDDSCDDPLQPHSAKSFVTRHAVSVLSPILTPLGECILNEEISTDFFQSESKITDQGAGRRHSAFCLVPPQREDQHGTRSLPVTVPQGVAQLGIPSPFIEKAPLMRGCLGNQQGTPSLPVKKACRMRGGRVDQYGTSPPPATALQGVDHPGAPSPLVKKAGRLRRCLGDQQGTLSSLVKNAHMMRGRRVDQHGTPSPPVTAPQGVDQLVVPFPPATAQQGVEQPEASSPLVKKAGRMRGCLGDQQGTPSPPLKKVCRMRGGPVDQHGAPSPPVALPQGVDQLGVPSPPATTPQQVDQPGAPSPLGKKACRMRGCLGVDQGTPSPTGKEAHRMSGI